MTETGISKAAWWLFLLALAVVAWQAGQLTWKLWEADELVVLDAKKGSTSSSSTLHKNYKSWNLFGKQEIASNTLTQPKVVDTPETRLRLQLLGVVVSDDPQESSAIISEQGRNAEYYKVGDKLPGNALLDSVFQDHILLSRNGAIERLTFDEAVAAGSSNAIAAVASSEVDQPEEPEIESPEQFLDVAQQRLAANPRAALASVGLSPSSTEEGPAGYVYNGRNPMLASMNMQKGDVIRSVNGHQLGDIEQDRAKLQELYESGYLEVEIEREGATFTINYPLR